MPRDTVSPSISRDLPMGRFLRELGDQAVRLSPDRYETLGKLPKALHNPSGLTDVTKEIAFRLDHAARTDLEWDMLRFLRANRLSIDDFLEALSANDGSELSNNARLAAWNMVILGLSMLLKTNEAFGGLEPVQSGNSTDPSGTVPHKSPQMLIDELINIAGSNARDVLNTLGFKARVRRRSTVDAPLDHNRIPVPKSMQPFAVMTR